jgi:diguanylate cyclase (GGDEF)-like protein/PAS domain S-box-containing protein
VSLPATDKPGAEIERLQDQVRELTRQASHLQLILRMIERISPLPGVHNMVGGLLRNIREALGGDNIKMWYWIEDALFFADVLGARTKVTAVDDPLAQQVATARRSIEQDCTPAAATWTCAFPLQAGSDLVGVVKLENVNGIGAVLRDHLPVFFGHAALLLGNEIRGQLRQRAQAALRLAASVFANSQEGIVISDAANRILDVNDSFCRISGYTREEVIGRDPNLLRSGRQNAEFYAAMWRAIKETGSWRGEVWNRRKSGEIYAEMLSIDAVVDEAGKVQHYVGAFSDISQLKEHEAELERIAHYDTLTGLPNRRLLADRLTQELARTRRGGRTLAICYLDLDGFKPINDLFGHEAGDRVLIEIARRLQNVSRAGDTVGRLGGDEFVLLFCDLTHEQEGFHALDRVLATVARPLDMGTQQANVSASIGVTLFPHDDADADTLLRHADEAMYQAKEAGKSRFHLYDAEQDRKLKADRESLEQLHLALREDEFVLLYQPKVDMVSGEVVGAEGLIRWQHPQRGLLSPSDFLPLLAATSLEITLGEWVIEAALSQLERWQADGLRLAVSINIGAHHLLHRDFTRRLGELLARHPTVAPHDLELEILESAAIDDMNHASRTLAGCMALGVRFALDHFGTGYVSLTNFRKLPAGTLKIDQGFVSGIIDDPEDLGIIESVVGLAKAFNRPVIAEGVETVEHGAMLVMLGCALGQGHGIARPMAAALLPGWIKEWHGEDIWRTLGEYVLPPEDLVLVVANRANQRWSERLVKFVGNPVDNAFPAVDHHQCPFGRWYFGSGVSRYGHLGEFSDLDRTHLAMHSLAAEMVKLSQTGDSTSAMARLTEFQQLRDKLASGIDRLIDRVRTTPESSAPAWTRPGARHVRRQ